MSEKVNYCFESLTLLHRDCLCFRYLSGDRFLIQVEIVPFGMPYSRDDSDIPLPVYIPTGELHLHGHLEPVSRKV